MTWKEKRFMWLEAALVVCILMVPGAARNDNDTTETSSAEFLQSVINRLRMELEHTYTDDNMSVKTVDADNHKMEIMGPTPVPPNKDFTDMTDSAISSMKNIMHLPPSFSKEELALLFKVASQKGALLHYGHLFDNTIATKNNHISQLSGGSQKIPLPTEEDPLSETVPGYYYYFYPIKNFMKNLEVNTKVHNSSLPELATKPGMSNIMPTAMMLMDATSSDRHMEPLFMAMASFIGMALMFVFSMLFLPNFGDTVRTRSTAALQQAPDDIAALTRIVTSAIDSNVCSERVACETGRMLRRMELQNDTIRVLEAIMPISIRKQVQQIRSLAARKKSCNLIDCRRKSKNTTQ